jgi:hypothetical protein
LRISRRCNAPARSCSRHKFASKCIDRQVERRDEQLVAGHHVGLGRATRRASKDGVVKLRVGSAESAFDHRRYLAHFEWDTVERGTENNHVPAVTQRIWHDLAQMADVDTHSFDRPTGRSLMSDLGDRRADRKFVHSQRLENEPTRRRLDNRETGI